MNYYELEERARGMRSGKKPLFPDLPAGSRLRFLFLGENNRVIGDILGVHATTVQNWMKTWRPGVRGGPQEYNLEIVELATGVSREWLLEGRGPVFSREPEHADRANDLMNSIIADQLELPEGRDYCRDFASADLIINYFEGQSGRLAQSKLSNMENFNT